MRSCVLTQHRHEHLHGVQRAASLIALWNRPRGALCPHAPGPVQQNTAGVHDQSERRSPSTGIGVRRRSEYMQSSLRAVGVSRTGRRIGVTDVVDSGSWASEQETAAQLGPIAVPNA